MAMPLSREFRLALACATWPPSPRRIEAVRLAAQEPIVWPAFLRIVNRNRIWGMAYDGLTRADVELPASVAADLGAHAASVARQNLNLAANPPGCRAPSKNPVSQSAS